MYPTDAKLPLSIRDVAPAPEAVRLTGTHPNGTPDGLHTGGAWLLNGEVWKPLDGRPFANCEFHYPTNELACLQALAGQPLFPMNWRAEERNGRWFVVRRRAVILGQDMRWNDSYVDRALLRHISDGVRSMNRAGWEVGDTLTIGIDDDERAFIVDLSASGQVGKMADEGWRIKQLLKQSPAGRPLALLEENARAAHEQAFIKGLHPGFCVYASFARPLELVWASKLRRDGLALLHQQADWEAMQPHTWVFSHTPLEDEILTSYELDRAYEPVHAV